MALDLMRTSGQPQAAVDAYARLLALYESGDTGLLGSTELEPAPEPERLERLPAADGLDGVVAIRLNGGLGTTMGLDGPKSLIEVKPGLTFLDVIRLQTGDAPLVLMNSFATSEASRAAAPEAIELLQHRVPRLGGGWAPPGHGDLYTALHASGLRDELLAQGLSTAFVANADNLGATADPRIAAWVRRERIPFVLEVVEAGASYRKGGHLALHDGRLISRETAQVPPDDPHPLTDHAHWRWYSINTVWLDLERAPGPVPELPLIVNRKGDKVQLETAMGAAIGLVDGARALLVGQDRFAPVKTTDDLLVLRSDATTIHDDGRVEHHAAPLVELDPAFFGRLADFEARIPDPPSLRACTRLAVHGDVRFGSGVTVIGDVAVSADVPDGTVLR